MRIISGIGVLTTLVIATTTLLFEIVHATEPFRFDHELFHAVDIYLDMDERYDDDIVPTYGFIQDWDVSQITNFGALFSIHRNPSATYFNADLSNWDMSSSRMLHDMFLGASSFDSDLGGWDVRNVIRFNGLFYGATSFTGQGLNDWDVSNGRLFMSMFSNTRSLRTDLDLRKWDVSNAESMNAMFRGSNFGGSMDTNNLCGWADKLRSNVNMYAMFLRSGCPFKSDPKLDDLESGFDFCVKCPPPSEPAIAFGTNVELFRAVDIFLGGTDDRFDEVVQTYGAIEDWDVSQVTNFGGLFSVNRNDKAENFNADLSRWNVGSNARVLHDMFLGCAAFDSDLGGWNVGSVTRFNGLFFGAASFTGRGLEKWDVSSGRFFMSMFSDTPSLRPGLDIRDWNVINAESMVAMFRGSSFGNGGHATSNLCSWTSKLNHDVKTKAMFLRSGCPFTSDPQLHDLETGTDFCTSCSPANTTNGDGEDTAPPRRPNVLFIMTDQQRFDAIRRVQEELPQYDDATKIRTPNLDRLSRSGVYFRTAYCQCSVCAPARASLRTGCTIERTGIQHNELTREYLNSPLFTERVENLEGLDQILAKLGYVSEYFGKWHLPNTLYRTSDRHSDAIRYNDYDYVTGEFNLRTDSWGRKVRRYLKHFELQGIISRENPEIPAGMQQDIYTGFPYNPIQIDSRYGYPSGTSLDGFPGYLRTQPNLCGNYSLSENFTPSHFNGDIALKALNRLLAGDQPFFLTVSFHNPHPPMLPAWKHLEYYWEKRNELWIPASIDDRLENADYGSAANMLPKYSDPVIVQEWTAVYYALIEEIDEIIGSMLDALGDSADDTLIIFTSDHGEMLGAHGSREKNNFLEESSRVPLFFAFDDKIKPGTVVDEPVSHLDVFATILDYIGAGDLDNSDGKSLRSLIEKRVYNEDYEEDFTVAEWDFRKPLLSNHDLLDRRMDERPSLMVRKGPFKLMTHKLASSNEIDMMYDLHNDPYELHNLVGANAAQATAATLGKAEHLRCLLLEWMERLDGEKRYYSDPMANYGQGLGDIEELRMRQSWPPLYFWVGDDSMGIGRLVLQQQQMTRSEFLYMGTRMATAAEFVAISITGPDAAFFHVDQDVVIIESLNCQSVKITFSAPPEMFVSAPERNVEASIVVRRERQPDLLIPLFLEEQNWSEVFSNDANP